MNKIHFSLETAADNAEFKKERQAKTSSEVFLKAFFRLQMAKKPIIGEIIIKNGRGADVQVIATATGATVEEVKEKCRAQIDGAQLWSVL